MKHVRKVTLREKDLQTAAEAHELLARELDFPEYYGNNLDALEDCLGDVCEPVRIVLKRDRAGAKPWFDGFVGVISDVAQQGGCVRCVVR